MWTFLHQPSLSSLILIIRFAKLWRLVKEPCQSNQQKVERTAEQKTIIVVFLEISQGICLQPKGLFLEIRSPKQVDSWTLGPQNDGKLISHPDRQHLSQHLTLTLQSQKVFPGLAKRAKNYYFMFFIYHFLLLRVMCIVLQWIALALCGPIQEEIKWL